MNSPSFDWLHDTCTCKSPDPFCPFLMIILYFNFYKIKKGNLHINIFFTIGTVHIPEQFENG